METLQRTANRGSISTGYDIDNSCKFEADNQEEFLRTPSSASNMKTWTVSLWFKRTELGTNQMLFGSADTYLYIGTGDEININFRGASENFFLITNRLFRDTSAWYHFVVVCDFTNSTAADRGRLYVNGVRETSYSNSTYQNAHSGVNSYWNNTVAQSIGGQNASTTFQSSGYMAEVHSVDGSALTADSFGEFDEDSGIWKPKAYTGSYGTNGFYLDYSSASDMGNDSSGNNNDFSPQNINQNDQATDTPTNNFATLNPLGVNHGSAVISDGATKIDGSGSTTEEAVYSSICVTSGKWYAEVTPQLGSFNTNFGIVNIDTATFDGTAYNNAGYWLGNFDSGAVIYYYANGSGGGTSTVNVTTGVVIGLALDLDNNTLDFYVNGSQNKQMTSLPSGTYGFIADVQGTGGPYIQCNFGGYTVNTISSAASDDNGYGTFEYAPPSGYYALCTKNLAEYG